MKLLFTSIGLLIISSIVSGQTLRNKPYSHFGKLDSLLKKQNKLEWQSQKFFGRTPMLKPDSSVKYNMPLYVPDSSIKYNMPIYTPEGFAKKDSNSGRKYLDDLTKKKKQ
ncbi:MAG: hypothetical protein GYA14_10640 [Ignavibacteria bacterium]|nr:hypothetical protein [Ignavibacteria bacterium]